MCQGTGHMKETSSSTVTSLLQGEKLASRGLFKELNTPWPGNNWILFWKKGKRPDLKDAYFFHGLDFPWPKEGQRNAWITQCIGFLSTYLFVTLESTWYALSAIVWEIAWKWKPCLQSGWCVVYFCGVLWVIICLCKFLSNRIRIPFSAVRNQSTSLVWIKLRLLSKVKGKNKTVKCLETWATSLTTSPQMLLRESQVPSESSAQVAQ